MAGNVTEISTVVEVIRSIAEQTNLLALNAAIEAARAGESGRGFAVVADEVRALASRTQQSTEEIERMIYSVQDNTNKLVSDTQVSGEYIHNTHDTTQALGESLNAVVESVGGISSQTLSIASAVEEQAMVAKEVDRNITTIRDLALQSSSQAKQASQVSQELASLASQLNTMIERFQV